MKSTEKLHPEGPANNLDIFCQMEPGSSPRTRKSGDISRALALQRGMTPLADSFG